MTKYQGYADLDAKLPDGTYIYAFSGFWQEARRRWPADHYDQGSAWLHAHGIHALLGSTDEDWRAAAAALASGDDTWQAAPREWPATVMLWGDGPKQLRMAI